MSNQRLLLLFITLSIIGGSCAFSQFHRESVKKNRRLAGQAAPPDMVFIEGNNNIESFYMSATEEPNINYVIYLRWLERVYGESYPEVFIKALPLSAKKKVLNYQNDPFLHSYLTHPAFAYYPVTGLSWEQIQQYLQWKTDRLNETILIKKGILNFNPDQQDEDNFVTEAYLTRQYQGDVRKNIPDDNPTSSGERAVRFSDGMLFTGLRLPTETEWEYAKQKSVNAVFDDNHNYPFPIGQSAYIVDWRVQYKKYFKVRSLINSSFKSMDYHYQSSDFSPISHYPFSKKEYQSQSKSDSLLTMNFPIFPTEYGLINMEGGVKEWLIDKYEEEYVLEYDWKKVYRKAGFAVDTMVGLRSGNYYDGQNHVEKDSLGHMRHFRYMDVNEYGQPYEVGYRPHPAYEKLYQEEIRLLDEYLKKQRRNPSFYNTIEGQELLRQLEEIRTKQNKIAIDRNRDFNRVVKGGTWQKSGSFRQAMQQQTAADDVGFRCVLPYTGLPTLGRQVKW